MISELEATVQARDEFPSIASHELRNPVNAVHLQLVGILRAFQRSSSGTDEVGSEGFRDRVTLADAQLGRLTRLLDNLLDLSRIRGGAIALELEDVDLKEVVEHVIDQFLSEAVPGQINFNAHHSVVGRWDRLRLEQIVSNLLSNAIKYGEGGRLSCRSTAMSAPRGYPCRKMGSALRLNSRNVCSHDSSVPCPADSTAGSAWGCGSHGNLSMRWVETSRLPVAPGKARLLSRRTIGTYRHRTSPVIHA